MKSGEKHTTLTHTQHKLITAKDNPKKKKKQALQRRSGALLMKMRNEQNWVSDIRGRWEYNITLVEL